MSAIAPVAIRDSSHALPPPPPSHVHPLPHPPPTCIPSPSVMSALSSFPVNTPVGKDEFSDILNAHGFKKPSDKDQGPQTLGSLKKQTVVVSDPIQAKVGDAPSSPADCLRSCPAGVLVGWFRSRPPRVSLVSCSRFAHVLLGSCSCPARLSVASSSGFAGFLFAFRSCPPRVVLVSCSAFGRILLGFRGCRARVSGCARILLGFRSAH